MNSQPTFSQGPDPTQTSSASETTPLMSPLTEDPSATRRFFSRIGFSLLALTGVYTLAAVLLQLIFSIVCPAIFDQWWYVWLMSLLPLYGFGLPAMYLVLRGLPVAPRSATYSLYGIQTPMPRLAVGWWFVIAVIAMGYMYIGSIVGNGLMSLLSWLTHYDYSNALEDAITGSPLWITFLCTAVAAPLGEELLFRKLLIDRTRRYGDGISILLSAFFFAIFHGNLFQFFYAFALGLLLGYLYTRTGKMRWNIALHAFVNLMGGVLPQMMLSNIDMEVLASGDINLMMEMFAAHPIAVLCYMVQSMLVYPYIIAAIVLTICLCVSRKVKLGQGSVVIPHGKRFLLSMVNVGMILALLICVALLVMNLLPL